MEVVGHGGLRRARLRGHEAGAEGVEEGEPAAAAAAHGTLGGGGRRGDAGQLAAAAGVAPPPGRCTPAGAPHLSWALAAEAADACGDGREEVSVPRSLARAALMAWNWKAAG